MEGAFDLSRVLRDVVLQAVYLLPSHKSLPFQSSPGEHLLLYGKMPAKF